MAQFKVVLESVPVEETCISLFNKISTNGNQPDADTSSSNISGTIKRTLSTIIKRGKEQSMEVDDFEVVEPFIEYLMYLDAEQACEDRKVDKKAEIIVVVDKSGSMQGTPWRQVQSALNKMLDITRGVNNCQAIAYNQGAEIIPLSGSKSKDKLLIDSIRAGGSTNFVAVFKQLEKLFQDDLETKKTLPLKKSKNKIESLVEPESVKRDKTVPHYIFLMTDGHDTCNAPRDIVAAKEHLQAKIEQFGGEVVFNVLGFSDDHNEEFLESLALIGTSDGSYSFVSPSEGEKALEERLVALVQSTSKNIGRLINIEATSNNVEFLGDWFGEAEKEVILPAKMSEKGEKISISTRKFVRIKVGEEPNLSLKIHEKLTGDEEAQEAMVICTEKIELKDKSEIDIHNLKKLRSAMNLVSGRMGDTENAEKDTVAKSGYELVKNKVERLKELDTKNADIKRLLDNVKGLVKQMEIVFEPGRVSEREQVLRGKAMRSVQACPKYGQSQNLLRQMKKSHTTSKGESSRSAKQTRVKQTDYSNYSDEEEY